MFMCKFFFVYLLTELSPKCTHENVECYPWVVSVPCNIKGKSLLKFCLGLAFRNIGETIVTPYNSVIVGTRLDSRLVSYIFR